MQAHPDISCDLTLIDSASVVASELQDDGPALVKAGAGSTVVLDGAPCDPESAAAAASLNAAVAVKDSVEEPAFKLLHANKNSSVSSSGQGGKTVTVEAAAAAASKACTAAEEMWRNVVDAGLLIPMSRHFLSDGRHGFSLGRFPSADPPSDEVASENFLDSARG